MRCPDRKILLWRILPNIPAGNISCPKGISQAKPISLARRANITAKQRVVSKRFETTRGAVDMDEMATRGKRSTALLKRSEAKC